MIADLGNSSDEELKVLGFSVKESHGIQSGVIVDISAAEQAIRFAVHAAESKAGFLIDSVIINCTCCGMKSEHVRAEVPIDGDSVRIRDIRRVLSLGLEAAAHDPDRVIIHSLPLVFTLDGEQDVVDPKDMIGKTLGVEMHVVTATASLLRNLEHCVNRAHLNVERMVATPFASGLASLVGDEARLGAACIDFGSATTTISIFTNGNFVFAESLSVGGHNITLDIARGFSISVEEAERVKVVYGSVLFSDLEDKATFHSGEYSCTLLSRIIRARMEEILEMVRDRLVISGFESISKLIFTGGASQLTGFLDVALKILGHRIRMGCPIGMSGLPDMAKAPAFSTTVGLLIYFQSVGFNDWNFPSYQERLSDFASDFLYQWFCRIFK
jgi:cell division protein FtsA